MTHHQRVVRIVEMHSAALAVPEKIAVGADAGLCPVAVAEFLETVVPDVHEIVCVDVALTEICPNARTCRNVAIAHHRCHRNPRLAGVEKIAHIALVTSEKPLATVTHVFALGTAFFDEIHQLPHLCAVELEVGVDGGTSGWERRKHSPTFHANIKQFVFQFVEFIQTPRRNAGGNVPIQPRCLAQQAYGVECALPTVAAASHIIVIVLVAVKTNRCAAQSTVYQRFQAVVCQQHTVADNAPWIFAAVEFTPDVFDVVAQQRFAAGDDYHQVVIAHKWGYLVDDGKEIVSGHILDLRFWQAGTSAMSAMKIATQRTFPKQLPEFVEFLAVVLQAAGDFKSDAFFQRQFHFYSSLMVSSVVFVSVSVSTGSSDFFLRVKSCVVS